jgi:hypothetical protein
LEGIKYINDYKNTYTIKCHQKNCNVLSFQLSSDEDLHSDRNVELENSILKELYLLEKKFKSQRLLQLMKKFNKTDHKIVARLINKLEEERIIKVVGSDMFIEINKTHLVKKRIGIL